MTASSSMVSMQLHSKINLKPLSITPTLYQMKTQQTSVQTLTKQTIHCPNCGSLAERWYYSDRIQTECAVCDYLMVTCSKTGNVIEAQAPGLYAGNLQSVKSVVFGVK